MKRTEVITVQRQTVPYIYNTTCKEMFPNIDVAMTYVGYNLYEWPRVEEYVLNVKKLPNSSLIILNIIL